MKKNVSYAHPLLEVIHEDRNKAQDDSELREMFKQMNNQMIEQKIVVAKINKLCLGALTSIEHFSTSYKIIELSEILAQHHRISYNILENIASHRTSFKLLQQSGKRLLTAKK